jgi:FixJ family two-component response regulator
VQLGGISGLELSRRLTAAQDPTPVIFITAQDDPALRTQAMAEGCAGFFRKTDPGFLVMDAIRRTVGALGTSARSQPPTGGPVVPESSVVARSHSKPL